MKRNTSLLPSTVPPGNLKQHNVPMFVSFGFDDNGITSKKNQKVKEGVRFISHLFSSFYNPLDPGLDRIRDKCSCTFFNTTKFLESSKHLSSAWADATSLGHEIGLHTHNHCNGINFSTDEWIYEIETCIKELTNIGICTHEGMGFRSPYLLYNEHLFKALSHLNIKYDCSIHEGYQTDLNFGNFYWPYTLDEGSPGNRFFVKEFGSRPLLPVNGIWEIPTQVFVIPQDSECEKYGIIEGFRNRLYSIDRGFNVLNGKITAFDYNCLVHYRMNKSEYLGVMKYNYDLRLKGNRSPLTIGGHSDIYSPLYDRCPNITFEERCEALYEFVCYILLNSNTRIVSHNKLISWLEEVII